MRQLILMALVLFSFTLAYAEDSETDSLIRSEVRQFMLALQTGDGPEAAEMFSTEALEQVNVMLVSIKQSLDRDPDATIRRLNGAGYSVDLEVAEDWETEDYLSATLSLPMISARYAPYELEIDSVIVDNRSAIVEMIFLTSSGTEIPQQALMAYEDDTWKISNFMGITAFP